MLSYVTEFKGVNGVTIGRSRLYKGGIISKQQRTRKIRFYLPRRLDPRPSHTNTTHSSPRELISFEPVVEKPTTDRFVTFRFVLPAVKEQDLKTSVEGRKLIVSGRKEAPSHLGQVEVKKLAYCAFERTIELSDDLDPNGLDARLHDGVFDVRIPREASKRAGLFPLDARKAAAAARATSTAGSTPVDTASVRAVTA